MLTRSVAVWNEIRVWFSKRKRTNLGAGYFLDGTCTTQTVPYKSSPFFICRDVLCCGTASTVEPKHAAGRDGLTSRCCDRFHGRRAYKYVTLA